MNRHVRAYAPTLFNLAQESKYASLCVDNSTTYLTKKANVVNLDGINYLLVKEAIKLGSAVLQSISASKDQDLLTEAKRREDQEEATKESMDLKKGLLTGAAITAVPALATNYMLNKASDDLEAKMMAIPGLAAATVGAILAAKSMSTGDSQPSNLEAASELESALNAKGVVDSALASTSDQDVVEDLKKMSSISTEHIASLITDILL